MNYLQTLRLFNRNTRLYLGIWPLIGFGYFGIVMVTLNLYMLRLGLGTEAIGLTNSVGWLAVAVFALPSAWLGVRFGIRRMIILGLILCSCHVSCRRPDDGRNGQNGDSNYRF